MKKINERNTKIQDNANSERRSFVSGLCRAAGLLLPINAASASASASSIDATLSPALAHAPQEIIELWPEGVVGKSAQNVEESIVERSSDPLIRDRHIAGVTTPRLLVFRPAKPNGASMLILPGGGYRWVVIDREGIEMAHWLAARGITAFVLFYRLPGDGWTLGSDVALVDAQRAMRMIRQRANQYALDTARLAVMGFSAGGHLCADLMVRHAARVQPVIDKVDEINAKPFIAAPIYPVISMSAPHAHVGSRERLIGRGATLALENKYSPHLHVWRDNCPTFLLHAEDDKSVPVENTLLLRAALASHAIVTETHLFQRGGHGFGLRKAAGLPAALWPELFLAWAKTHAWF